MLKNQLQYNFSKLILCAVLLLSTLALAQLDIPKKPGLQTSVYDGAKMMSGYEKNALEQKLIKYSDTTSTQIVVATITNLKGEDIAYYATKWAHEWGIGQKVEDNGVFVLVAKDDRKLWIATGYGVEHLLTDAMSKRIIERVILPEFKQGNFYQGLDKGTTAIMQVLNGEYQGVREDDSTGTGIPIFFIILFFIILLIILSNRNRGNRGGRRYYDRNGDAARSLLEAIILSRAGRGGFGGGGGFGGSSGGFGGGGFGGGFGGGGFGGGGAGGSW